MFVHIHKVFVIVMFVLLNKIQQYNPETFCLELLNRVSANQFKLLQVSINPGHVEIQKPFSIVQSANCSSST